MTALTKYDRLEAFGLWRSSPDAQLREVILSFGDTSLIIRDRAEAPLTHWSLPAIERINPGKRPALFEPGSGAGETLEIEDDMMIDAIEEVRRAIKKSRPRKGRLRLAISAALLVALGALGATWLPDALVDHTLNVVPETKRAEIGRDLLRDVTRVTGPLCRDAMGASALARFKARVVEGEAITAIHVMPSAARETVLLPGHVLLISNALLKGYDTPEVAAGYVLASGLSLQAGADPLRAVLEHAGTRATLELLTTGQLDRGSIRSYARHLMTAQPAFPDDLALLEKFEQLGISSVPYAYARDPSGETTLGLIEADPARFSDTKPLLNDSTWLSLKAICGS